MRVLLVNDYFSPFEVGGAEQSVQALATLLTQRGIDVEVLSRSPASVEPPRSNGPFRVHFVPYRRHTNPLLGIWEREYFSSLRMASRLAQLTSSGNYDIVHAHNETSAIAVFLARRSGTPLPPSVLTVRGYSHMCPLGHGLYINGGGALHCGLFRTALCVWEGGPPSPKRILGLLPFTASTLVLHRLAREAVRYFDRYLCISSFLGRALRVNLGVDPRRIEIVPEFLNVQHLKSGKDVSPDHSNVRTILYVGRLVREKGLQTLVEAFGRVVHRDRSVRLIIVGGGGLRSNLEGWVSKHGLEDRITFVGPVSHSAVGSYIAQADIVVVPSTWPEPLGIVILEALYLGRAVIASSHGGIPDMIQDGVNGLLVPPADPTALSQAMLTLLRDPHLRDRLQRRGPKTIAERFAPRELAQRTIEIYQELLGAETRAVHTALPPRVD